MEESESMYVVGADNDLMLVRKRWGLWASSDPALAVSQPRSHVLGGVGIHLRPRDARGEDDGAGAYGDASRFPDPDHRVHPDGLVIDTEGSPRCLPLIRAGAPRRHMPGHGAKVQAELERAVLYSAGSFTS